MTTWDTLPSLVYNNQVIAEPSDFQGPWQYREWFHLRITYESSGRARAYLNDELLGEAIVDVPHSDFQHWSFRFGNFEGYLDELRVSTSPYDSGGTTPLTVETWRSRFFSAADLGDSSKEDTHWGDNADTHGDGLTKLTEYYFI